MLENEEKSFKIALVVSILCHSVLFFPFHSPFLKSNLPQKKSIELTYYSSKQKLDNKSNSPTNKYTVKKVKLTKKSTRKRNRLVKPIRKVVSVSKAPQQLKSSQVRRVKPVTSSEMKKVRSYLGYYQLLRQMIKRHIEYPNSLSNGEVYLSFVLNSNGTLRMIKIDEKDSTRDVLLRTAALESIHRAAPFPPLPGDFKQNEATFNVIISFQIK